MDQNLEDYIKDKNNNGELEQIIKSKSDPEDILKFIKDLLKHANIDNISNIGSTAAIIEELENKIRINKITKSKSLLKFVECLNSIMTIDYDIDDIYDEFKNNNHRNIKLVPKSVTIKKNYFRLYFVDLDESYENVKKEFSNAEPNSINDIDKIYNSLKTEITELSKGSLYGKSSIGIFSTIAGSILSYFGYEYLKSEAIPTELQQYVILGTSSVGILSSYKIYKSMKRTNSNKIIELHNNLLDLINKLNKQNTL